MAAWGGRTGDCNAFNAVAAVIAHAANLRVQADKKAAAQRARVSRVRVTEFKTVYDAIAKVASIAFLPPKKCFGGKDPTELGYVAAPQRVADVGEGVP